MPEFDYTIYYRAWHDESKEHASMMSRGLADQLRKLLPVNRNVPLLDVGCGMGFAMLAALKLGYNEVDGIDIDAGQVRVAQSHGLRAVQVTDTIEFLSQKKNHYGVILLMDVLEHVPVAAQIDMVRALAGALQPGGTLVVQVPNANSALAARWRYNDYTHHGSFTEHSLKFVLLNAGLQLDRIEEMEFFQRPHRPYLPRKNNLHWLLLRFFRSMRRLEMMAELGFEQGRAVPLSLNLIGVCKRPE